MFKWEKIETCGSNLGPQLATLYRAKVPGGWLVYWYEGITFYPDPNHKWDGTSLN
ncbi:conserved hypothetical protein [Candidatus Magnetomoraceae bacterium gMMP-13]